MEEFDGEYKLEYLINDGEKILWKGRPSFEYFKKTYINNIVTYIVILFNIFFIYFLIEPVKNIYYSDGLEAASYLAVVNILPAAIYAYFIYVKYKNFKNTEYVLTDKTVYISYGSSGFRFNSKYILDISSVETFQDSKEELLDLGDTIIKYQTPYAGELELRMQAIPDYEYVSCMIEHLQNEERHQIERRRQNR